MKVQKTHKRYNLDDLPPEIINHIFSFLLVKECEDLESVVNGTLGDIVRRNIYGRSVLYINNRHLSMLGNNPMTQMLFKYVDKKMLQLVVKKDIIPHRFVLSYNYNRSECEDFEHDHFLKHFETIYHELKETYFQYCENVEVSVDLFNKKFDSGEALVIETLLQDKELENNLSYLNLNRFQRLDTSLLDSFSLCLQNNLNKFSKLHTLTLASNNITDISNWKFPPSLLMLNLMNNKLTSLPQNKQFLPPKLVKLNLSCNNLKNLNNIVFPETLEYLDLQLNNISKLSNLDLPKDLKVLIASGNNIMFDDNESVWFPENLVYLNLLQNPYLNNLNALNFNQCLKHIYIDATIQDKRSSDVITYM